MPYVPHDAEAYVKFTESNLGRVEATRKPCEHGIRIQCGRT